MPLCLSPFELILTTGKSTIFHCRFSYLIDGLNLHWVWLRNGINKENNVFKDALGVKGLGFKRHGNHPGNHGSHYGNHQAHI